MRSEPSLADRARTALADASTATLVTRGCRSSHTCTVVAVEDQATGRPAIRVDRESPAVQLIAGCPVVTIAVPGPAPYRSLQLVGTLRGRPAERDRKRVYQLCLLSVRLVGAGARSLPVDEFLAAGPDPLRHCAPQVLAHLEHAHTEDLLACVRAHGHDVHAVVPRGLDRYGIELAAIGYDGVHQLRLSFPNGPIDDLAQLSGGVRLPLTCHCGDQTG